MNRPIASRFRMLQRLALCLAVLVIALGCSQGGPSGQLGTADLAAIRLSLVGQVTKSGSRIVAEFRLWDIFAGEQIRDGQRFTIQNGNVRRLAHIIADEIHLRITGEPGWRIPDVFYGGYVRDPDGNKLCFFQMNM